MADVSSIYHEQQRRELCALHVLNVLFQDENTFTKADLDHICLGLSPESFINPHRSMLGLGNYDVNVLMAALQSKNMDTVWFDKRKDVKILNLKNIKGLILNVPSDFGIGFIRLPIKRKHWFAVREINGSFYNLDSKLSSPEVIGDTLDLQEYLRDLLNSGERELLLVVEPQVEKDGSWQRIT